MASSVAFGQEPADQSDRVNAYWYEETPYDSTAFAASHPSLLSTVGTMFGMSPPSLDDCRVLELGCASGGNIIPMAYSMPKSQFVGIELAQNQAAQGQEAIEHLQLTNVQIKNCSFMELPSGLGNFDYIIAHGVFSWVSHSAQEKIFDICREYLTANGLAYISYNALPGWHFRSVFRDMLLYHVADVEQAKAKAERSRMFAEFLAESAPQGSIWGQLLRDQFKSIQNAKESYFLHEYIEPNNFPIYLHQFIDRAQSHGLQYVGDSFISSMFPSAGMPIPALMMIRKFAKDPVQAEQLLDFINGRAFRSSILCRNELTLDRQLDPQRLQNFYISLTAETWKLETPPSLQMDKALQVLQTVFPQSLTVDEIISNMPPEYQASNYRDKLLSELFELLVNSEMITFAPHRFVFERIVSERPTTSPVARLCASMNRKIVSQLHRSLVMDQFMKELTRLCDGTRSREQIEDELIARAQSGEHEPVNPDEQPITEDQLHARIREQTKKGLQVLAKSAMLIA